MRKIYLMDHEAVDGTVVYERVAPEPSPRLGTKKGPVIFRRFVAAAETNTHAALAMQFGDDYHQALIDGDPEADMEQVGRFVSSLQTVCLSGAGEELHVSPQVLEILFNPAGEETERREPREVLANVFDEHPVRWTGARIALDKAVRRFVFQRTVQLKHSSGLTYQYLYKMAEELAREGVMVLMATGSGGKDPLIFSTNGLPYPGFLEGRIDGPKYKLLLHLSHLELKVPK
ncbi:MAG: hypothetical protein NZ729_01070 [Methylococcales bacterium]|nr:hypothetical protein [Methylococcales bacterium]